VPDAARLRDELARGGAEYLVADLEADLALQDVRVLVLVLVDVRRAGQRARGDRMLDKREVPGVDEEPGAEGAVDERLRALNRGCHAITVHCV
jgi:hypothetical protein